MTSLHCLCILSINAQKSSFVDFSHSFFGTFFIDSNDRIQACLGQACTIMIRNGFFIRLRSGDLAG